MASAGSIVVDLLARTGSFETDMDRAAKSAKRRAAEIDQAFSVIGKGAVTAGAAAGAAIVLMVKQTIDGARELQRQAQISNASADSFQRMATGAKTVGIEQDKLSDILKDVNDRVGDFLSTGGGPMKDFFEQIAPKVGVTADQFARLSGPEALQLYVSSLEKAGVSQQEMTFYLEAMASDTTALIPLLANGGAEMRRLGEEASRTGQIMSAETIAAAAELRGQMDQLSGLIQGARNIISGELIPTLIVAADEMLRFGGSGDLARFAADKLRVVLQELVIGAAEVTAWFQKSGLTLGGWAAQAGAIFAGDFAGAKFIGQELDRDLADIEGRLNLFRGRVRSAGSDLAASLGINSITPPTGGVGRSVSRSGGRAAASGRSAEDESAKAIARQIAALQDQAATFGLSQKSIELYRLAQMGANEAQLASAEITLSEIESLQLRNEQQDRLNALLAATPTEQLESQRETMLFLADAFEQGRISAEQFGEAASTALGNLPDAAAAAADSMTAFADQAARNMQSAFADFLFNPFEGGLRGMASSFAQTLHRMASEMLASQVFKMLGGFFGGPGAGPVGSLLGSFFGGARANGGPVAQGKTYLVGERGPELFTPNTAGAIVPNNELGSRATSSAPNIRIVNAFDASVVGDYLGSDAGEHIIMNAVRRNAATVRQVVAA